MVVDGSGNSVVVDITYSEDQRTIYIQPVEELVPGQYYIVYLDPGIKTVAPGYKMPMVTWSFQVAEEPGYGSLVGRLVDEHGDPFAPGGLEIRITQGDDRLRSPLIHANGTFEAHYLESGIWAVSFYVYGYDEYRINELIEGNQTTNMGTVTLHEEDISTSFREDIDYQFIGGACCLVTLLVVILILFVSNTKLKSDKEKKTKLVGKLENLLETPHEE